MQREGESQRTCDVVGFGENSVDLSATVAGLPAPDGKTPLESLETLPGGQIATAMVGCARLGLSARYLGSFGTDGREAVIRDALAHEGIDLSWCRIVDAPTRTALILVDTETHSRTVLWHRDSALLWGDELPVAAVLGAKVVLVDATEPAASARMARAARAVDVLTVADVDAQVPGLDALLAEVDVLVVSESLAGDIRHLHQESAARIVIATLGPHGAIAWDGQAELYSPGYVVPVTDTTGAGDAFRAGLIWALLERRTADWGLGTGDWRPWTADCLDVANAVAALNCRARGAQTGLPTGTDVRRFVTQSPQRRSKESWVREQTVSPLSDASARGDGE
ncbi:MAG: carbohydrate kinase family protein [Acidimicrobiia bacterium]|nr:carbohydrate kinase family protein [Acidimicrobiia bacterium]